MVRNSKFAAQALHQENRVKHSSGGTAWADGPIPGSCARFRRIAAAR